MTKNQTENTTVPIGNNQSHTLGISKISDKDKKIQVAAIMKTARPWWGNIVQATVDIRLLDIDMAYQRVSHKRLKTLIDEFDPNQMDAIQVSYRDGKFYVWDGQHRTIAAARNGILELPCNIHSGLTQADEAKRFSKQSLATSKLSTYDTYKANILWGEPIDMMLKELCDKYGITVVKAQKSSSMYTLSAIYASRCILSSTTCGYECLDWIFSVFEKTKWLCENNACIDDVLRGMRRVYENGVKNNDLSDRTDALIDTFSACRPNEVKNFAGVVINKEKRRNLAEMYNDISERLYTSADIKAYHFSNNMN